ncbi:hypothetical protein OOJ91_12610 [Micromonospora lupini]|uniref:hypothetical protein n=1 Tax=Micromonospora lupini TaxID=285679 RepID=UPI00224CF9D4|nr:hypothetical protein [Micromonospora lupini]MCX5066722.1 hypothetical protein [Micromonospora lupini]
MTADSKPMALLTEEAHSPTPAAGSAGTIALDELVTAIRHGRVVAIGSRWVIDVSRDARTAIDLGLAAKVGVEDQARLKLTRAGRFAFTFLHSARVLAVQKAIVQARQRGRDEVHAEAADRAAEVAEAAHRRRWLRTARQLAGAVLLLAAGAAIAILAMQAGR